MNGGCVSHSVGYRVAGPFLRFSVRHAVYRRVRPARLWRAPAFACALIAAALPFAGCSTNVPLNAQKEEEKPIHTGSIGATAAVAPVPDEDAKLPPEADLAYARIAVAEVLARGVNYASLPWENPRSGARGTVTPLASAYRVDGAICRDFLASYVFDGEEAWMQGEACRGGKGKGKWEVRRLKPWGRT